MKEKRKTISSVFLLLGLVSISIGVSFAFFNYTRTGEANTISVGRISFVTRQTKTISLTNLFPIDPTDSEEMSDAAKVGTVEIEIEGDTDYSDGVEYLISSENTNITTTGGKLVPISLSVEATNLGTASPNYFTAREDKNATIYKRLVGDTIVGDQMLLVGYIKPNTQTGTAEGIQNGKLTIKAYLDKNKILISDTYDGTESDNMGTPNSMARGKTVLTTTEWNALSSSGISFQIKVEANEGIWVNDTLDNIIRTKNLNTTTNQPIMDNAQSEFVSASTGIDFGTFSSSTNGQGIYMRAGTENDAYPIVYYRGAVENNNVLFNNKCWKAVRTTDTGGVKLIYNGEMSANIAPLSESEYTIVTNTANFAFDSSDNTWTRTITGSDGSSSSPLEISFKVPAGENYIMQITGTTSTSGQANITIYKDTPAVNGTGGGTGGALNFSYTYGTLTADNVIKMTYYGNGTSESPTIIKVKMVYSNETMGYGCNNSGTDAQITSSGTNRFAFNTRYISPAYVGYMYGDVYTYNSGAAVSGAYYGSGFTYSNGTYKLTNPSTTIDNTHHYTCNLTTAEGTCATIRYYYYVNSNLNYYINLTGGDGVEEALKKMQTNTNNSNAKAQIDTWYASNMNTVTNKLEDTIWCNDRSMGNGNNNGWIANGGDLNTYLYYGATERSNYASNTSTVKNMPSLTCTNKNDAFTVSNGNGNQKLTYPVSLLTSDEMTLAGGGGSGSTFYLASGAYYWSLSPYSFSNGNAFGFYVGTAGALHSNYLDSAGGLRPAISLKPGLPVIKGTGTVNDPYVVE